VAVVGLVVAAFLVTGCTLNAYTNTKLAKPDEPPDPRKPPAPQASFEIQKRPTKQQPEVLVLLALSGGGSRAAYFSARTMQALERVVGPAGGAPVNVLNEVDLISSVSGGSLASAYYASSYDPGPEVPRGRRVWDEPTVTDLMSRDYIKRWVGNWFWPANAARYWFTAFDRTDIMAQTFADNFFDSTRTGTDLRMRDLNPARPNLILNATIGSRSYDLQDPVRAKNFGTIFTFTREDFAAKLNSEIADYELARAVMSSATFPAAFNYMTLGDLHEPAGCGEPGKPCYVHVFDGGNSDNLGLVSLKRALLANDAAAIRKHRRIVVIFVDSFRRSLGADPTGADPRSAGDFFVDTNFLDATDSLLQGNRDRTLSDFFGRTLATYTKSEECDRDNLYDRDHACTVGPSWKGPTSDQLERELRAKMFFFHVTFAGVSKSDVRDKLEAIPTTFRFDDGEMEAIRQGVANLLADPANREAQECVQRLAQLITAPATTSPVVEGNPWCGGASPGEKAERQRRQKR
jgi:predicted acylesterase/phospholipase RssA